MTDIYLIGANHKTAPVELREQIAFDAGEVAQALERLKNDHGLTEAVLLSTCNRTEILYYSDSPDSVARLIQLVADMKHLDPDRFEKNLYVHKNQEAIRHLFMVASSLDSMIVGEPQILGQIKQAYKMAVAQNMCGVVFNRLLHKSFSIAKKVRRQTGIGDNAVSISYAAIELANKIFSDLSTKSVMLLGAGEMAELAVEHLMGHQVKRITVANRTFENAVSLAQRFNGGAIKFEERVEALMDVDIIISSTGATDYVLTAPDVKKIMKARKNAPLFFIDIAVPRDIDPKINRINNAYLYDIDDLNNIVTSNIEQREKETVKAGRLVDEAVIKFEQWMDGLKVVPSIKAINDKIQAITHAECEKTLAGLNLSGADADAIRRMTKAIATRTLHDPIRFLKNTGDHRDDSRYLSMARQLFNVDLLDEDE
ncbi:MAG: glutamyl-tRNA reductase [Desulfobacteraceae bacterium]|nr:MAG: glutamyl-tRNA reductase [Desulfobacteraceae bacterium]